MVYLDGEAGEPWEVEVDLPIIPNIEEDTVRIGSSRNPNYPFGLPDASDPEFVTDGNFIGNIDNLRIFNFVLTDIAAAELPDRPVRIAFRLSRLPDAAAQAAPDRRCGP